MKCNAEAESCNHCVWICKHIDECWKNIAERMGLILDIKLNKDTMCLLFGLPSTQTKNTHAKKLLYILTLCARKNILLKWVDCKPPTTAGWHTVIFNIIPMEYLTCRAKCMIKVFYQIWSLFLDYI